MIERIRYGGVSNPYNYSEFTCDTAADIADLPTNKDIGKYKNLDTCSVGSKATVISDRTMYILNGDNQWVLLKDYKATGGGSSILIDETLTESGQAADAKAVGDKIAEVDAKIDTTPWGDFIPGWDSDTSAMYCTVKLVSVLGKNSWQVLPSVSTVEHNAVELSPDGLFALDLKPDVNELKESAHTHSNKDVLDGITGDKITTWDGYSTEIQTVKTGLVGKKDSNSPNSTGEVFNNYSSNKAIGENSHAEGYSTKAVGGHSHAEGNGTTASGSCSHAEGFWAIAASNSSHAEGANTRATGSASHAEGSGCIASGVNSHAEGYNTKASGSYQHVQGKYNKEDSSSKYAFIIGNGTSDTARSNAFSVDWSGKIYVNNATEGVDVSVLATTIAELQSSVGDISTILSTMVEV